MRQCRRTDRPANLARGHANISTTQIYAHLDFQHLARVHDAAHPRARRKNAKIKKDADKSGLTRIEQKEIRDRASSGGGTNFALSASIRVIRAKILLFLEKSQASNRCRTICN
jgi:hypothetical protein